jgi:hypothetical protein
MISEIIFISKKKKKSREPVRISYFVYIIDQIIS